MFSESPELYDLIYGATKEYGREAADVAERLHVLAPDAITVLDVACGTGEHARHLHDVHGYETYGLDIEPGFVEIARNKLASGEQALTCCHRHLAPGGVVLVEPWFEPGAWTSGRVYVHTVDADGIRVVRMSHSTLEGHVSKLVFHYLIGTEDGVEHRVEHHDMGLFTMDELRGCFERAGFVDIELDPEGLIGRGLFTARANPEWASQT